MASSVFSLRAWQSSLTTSLQVLFGLEPSTSYSMHFFTQSLSSFRSTCPYQRSLFCCNTNAMSSIHSLSLSSLLGSLSFSLMRQQMLGLQAHNTLKSAIHNHKAHATNVLVLSQQGQDVHWPCWCCPWWLTLTRQRMDTGNSTVKWQQIAFSALTLLVGRQEEHLACKNWVMRCWCGYLSVVRHRLFAYSPADETVSQNPNISSLI